MYKLVKMPPNGRRIDILSDFDPDSLIAAGAALQKKSPKEQFCVTDDAGFYVWPERLTKSHLLPDHYDPSKAPVPDRYGSVDQ